MNLDDAQKQQVLAWISEGLKIADIQKRLETDLGLRLTYMEVRFLLDDLRAMPKDQALPQAIQTVGGDPKGAAKEPGPAPADAPQPPPLDSEVAPEPEPEPLPGSGGIKLTVDHVTRPGSLVSGSVTFSDGQSGKWYLDEMGRLGLGMNQKGYRPAQADIEEFQVRLQQEMAKQGY